MGGGILPTEEVVEQQGGERLGPDPLLSASSGSLVILAGPGIGLAVRGWKGATTIEIPEGWCREVSCC